MITLSLGTIFEKVSFSCVEPVRILSNLLNMNFPYDLQCFCASEFQKISENIEKPAAGPFKNVAHLQKRPKFLIYFVAEMLENTVNSRYFQKF